MMTEEQLKPYQLRKNIQDALHERFPDTKFAIYIPPRQPGYAQVIRIDWEFGPSSDEVMEVTDNFQTPGIVMGFNHLYDKDAEDDE